MSPVNARLTSALDDLDDPPPLVLRQRPRLGDTHGIAGLRRILFVVRFHALRARHHLPIHRVRHATLDRHHHRLLHLVAHDETGPRLPRAALRGLLFGHISHWSFPPFRATPS